MPHQKKINKLDFICHFVTQKQRYPPQLAEKIYTRANAKNNKGGFNLNTIPYQTIPTPVKSKSLQPGNHSLYNWL
jgi:hypothetical protein